MYQKQMMRNCRGKLAKNRQILIQEHSKNAQVKPAFLGGKEDCVSSF